EHRFELGQLLEGPQRRDVSVVVEVQLLQMPEGADLRDRIDAAAGVDLQLLELDELPEAAERPELFQVGQAQGAKLDEAPQAFQALRRRVQDRQGSEVHQVSERSHVRSVVAVDEETLQRQ